LILSVPAFAEQRLAKCADCHADQAGQFEASVHRDALRCQQCHGGADTYEAADVAEYIPRLAGSAPATTPQSRAPFDHGPSFRRPAPADVPTLCGDCHADVELMNAFGLPTDQLARYWVSGHGRRLMQGSDTQVAVCIDCHGTHDILSAEDPRSRTHFRKVSDTCGRCHADADLMHAYALSDKVVDQYHTSVHGQNVIQHSDAASPTCSTCHDAHGAMPPGHAEVGHVCSQCHEQIAEYSLQSAHGPLPTFPRCIGCHVEAGDPRNHRIAAAFVDGAQLREAYVAVAGRAGTIAGDETTRRFVEQVKRIGTFPRIEDACEPCHAPDRESGHAPFFEETDEEARALGRDLATAFREAQFEYARTTERVDRLARGALLVRDEAVRTEDAGTELTALSAFLHTLDLAEVRARAQKVLQTCEEVNAALDGREGRLVQRRWALLPVWCFFVVCWLLLRRRYRVTASAGADGGGIEVPARRGFLDAALRIMGVIGVVAVAWPALAYVRPARKRTRGVQRAGAGKESGWLPWNERRIVVAETPVSVIRTDRGFRAFSARCTHLGCLVRWDPTRRQYQCPCHAAQFDAEGKVVAGPPPTPLPEYKVAIVQGEVIVTVGP